MGDAELCKQDLDVSVRVRLFLAYWREHGTAAAVRLVRKKIGDAVTGRHVWAERYDRTLSDLFDIQDEITRSVAASTQTQLDLAEGAAGLPVFAGPDGGLAPLVGPTAGYLFGFVAAAFITGWLSERGWDLSVTWLFIAMGIGHIVILAAGFAWLAFGVRLGIEKAWLVGVLPFLAASVIKNTLGAVLIPAIRRTLDRRG